MGVTSSSRSFPTPTERRLTVGRVLGPKGLKGGVRVELLTDWPERLVSGAELLLDDGTEERRRLRIARIESGGRSFVLYFDGIADRTGAEALTGAYLESPAQPLADGSYYWADLIGLSVVDERGDPVGELVEIFRAGENEVYRIVGAAGERLVPALKSAVLDVDLAAGRMTVADDDAEEIR
jgi:16S rRNA processing protein RimM